MTLLPPRTNCLCAIYALGHSTTDLAIVEGIDTSGLRSTPTFDHWLRNSTSLTMGNCIKLPKPNKAPKTLDGADQGDSHVDDTYEVVEDVRKYRPPSKGRTKTNKGGNAVFLDEEFQRAEGGSMSENPMFAKKVAILYENTKDISSETDTDLPQIPSSVQPSVAMPVYQEQKEISGGGGQFLYEDMSTTGQVIQSIAQDVYVDISDNKDSIETIAVYEDVSRDEFNAPDMPATSAAIDIKPPGNPEDEYEEVGATPTNYMTMQTSITLDVRSNSSSSTATVVNHPNGAAGGAADIIPIYIADADTNGVRTYDEDQPTYDDVTDGDEIDQAQKVGKVTQPIEALQPPKNVCWYCQKKADPIHPVKVCSGCKIAKYCSRECQLKAWEGHKIECGIGRAESMSSYRSSVSSTRSAGAARTDSNVSIVSPEASYVNYSPVGISGSACAPIVKSPESRYVNTTPEGIGLANVEQGKGPIRSPLNSVSNASGYVNRATINDLQYCINNSY